MKKILIITLVLMMATTLLLARKHKNNDDNYKSKMIMHGNCEDMMSQPKMMDELKLSPEQKQKINNLRTEHRKSINTIKAEQQNLKLDLKTALAADNFNKAKEINKALVGKRTQLVDLKIDYVEALMKELNADQKKIAKEYMPRMMQGEMQPRKGQHGNMKNQKGDCKDDCKGDCKGNCKGDCH